MLRPARTTWSRLARLAAGLVAGGLLAACGTSPPPEPAAPAPTAPPPEDPSATDREMISSLNERARAGAVTETLHGVEVEDPYRLLEQDHPITQRWIEAQSDRAAEMLSEWSEEDTRQRLDTLLSIGVISRPAVGGERVFFLRRDGDREQAALFVTEEGEVREAPLVDPQTYGERAALDWYYPSPGGRYVAYGISDNGDERSTLHVIEVESGNVLEDRIPRAKWSNVEWLHDEQGFYYTRYPERGEPGFDAQNEDSYFPRVFFHALGTDPDDDPLVFGGERGTDFPSVALSEDDRWLVINVFRGWSASDVYLFDRGRSARDRANAPQGESTLRTVVQGQDHLTVGRVHGDMLYLHTNEGAPRYRIARVSPARASNVDAWRDVVPEGEAAIEDWTIVGDRIAVHRLDDVRSRIDLFRLDGREAGQVELPAAGSVEGLAGRPDDRNLVLVFSSYLHPPTLYRHDVRAGESLEEITQIEADVDFSPLTVERVTVTSADGTEVPVTLVHREDMQRDGNRPVLLYGYGGFNVSLLPSFTRSALYWVERGGVYAVANLRGGGEFGEDWHRAGNLENKERVFEDFEAAIRWFSESGVSRPERIAITGGSNGGLLMGAMITRVPEAFGAAASYVGLYDMLRYHEFPPAELWVSEYGSAEDPAQFEWLHGYSPYHHVRSDTPYPAILIETADHDTRVYWGHSTKFAARLQEATSAEDPILFYMVRSVGHGAGTRRSDLVDRYVRQYAFLEHALGLDAGE